jgi:hypothetical protein
MAEEKRTLEMRVAELEDKLAQLHISEEEMATYQKVASKLGAGSAPTVPHVTACIAAQCTQCMNPIIFQQCISPIRYPIIRPIYWADCIQQCFQGGGGAGGGGFGSLGG